MILSLKDVLELMEEIAPHEIAESWDNPGLQVGALNQTIKKIYFALDPTLDNIQKAISCKADLLFTHHPLILRPIRCINLQEYPGQVIEKAIKNGVSIVCMHTNLDSATDGINTILTELLPLNDVEILKESETVKGVGLGRIGNLKENMTLLDLINLFKKIFSIDKVRVVCNETDFNRPIKRIAIIGGSGGSLLSYAFQKKAELVVTGDVGYHDALNAISNGIILIDVGHFSSEKVPFVLFAKQFSERLKAKGFDIEVVIDEKESEPFTII